MILVTDYWKFTRRKAIKSWLLFTGWLNPVTSVHSVSVNFTRQSFCYNRRKLIFFQKGYPQSVSRFLRQEYLFGDNFSFLFSLFVNCLLFLCFVKLFSTAQLLFAPSFPPSKCTKPFYRSSTFSLLSVIIPLTRKRQVGL